MTPLLTRIERELATCTDPLLAAELRAERACYFARTGNFDGAKAIAAALRNEYGVGSSVRLSVWVMLIEGLVQFFESDPQQSRDRIHRAYALSKAAGDAKLRALTGVWLAHLEFERARYSDMAMTIIDVLDSIDEEAHAARSRLGMVLGDAFLFSGDRIQSQRWYEKSRWHSTAIGDQASVGALMYNRAAFSLSLLRVSKCLDEEPVNSMHLKFTEMELDSACSFQSGTGVTALTYLVDLCKARIAVLHGRLEAASVMLMALRERAKIAHNPADSASVEIDLAWCLVKTGKVAQAESIISEVKLEDIERLDVDDKLIAICALSEIFETIPARSVSTSIATNVGETRAAYHADVQALRAALSDVSRAVALRPSLSLML